MKMFIVVRGKGGVSMMIRKREFPRVAWTVRNGPISAIFAWSAVASLLVAGMILWTPSVGADDKNPFTGDPKAAKLGEFQFRVNCAFCHGLSARGGGRGPDLTKARKKHGNSDADLFRTISQGVAGTAMPAGTAGGIGVGMTDEEIWQVITYIRSVQVKAPEKPVGDAAHGKELFFGKARCATCHMVEGKGGRLGPDLTDVGTARATDYIVDSVRNPSRRLAQGVAEAMKEFPQEYETITVVTPEGKRVTGVALNEDSFTVQMMDVDEKIYLFEKDKLSSFQKSRESLMPPYDAKLLSDQELDDIMAFLLTRGVK